MKPIGGYFELELSMYDNFPIIGGVKVNSGRNALEYILRVIGTQNISRVFIPKYTCEVVLEPLNKLKIGFTFYDINDRLEIESQIKLKDKEYIVVNNYFGIKDEYIRQCIKQFGNKLIVDSSQALYFANSLGLKIFYSPRKFVGLPDGGIAWTSGEPLQISGIDESNDRCSHMLKRIDLGAQEGYCDFHENDAKLNNLPLRRMSGLTERLMQGIDFMLVKGDRCQNYDILRGSLQATNLLETPSSRDIACPMVYPYRTKDKDLRKFLIDNKIFVAKYWPNINKWCEGCDNAISLSEEILPLPIDQRYGTDDMQRIIKLIKE